MSNVETQKCSRCKGNHTFDKFKIKSDDSLTRTCIKCLKYKAANIKKNFCTHGKRRTECEKCDKGGYTAGLVRNRITQAIRGTNPKLNNQYINTDLTNLKKHIESRFTEGMTWDNYGEWQIDHIIPLKYNKPTFDEVVSRLDYKNTQPLWADDNMSKGNRLPDYEDEVEI